MVSLIGCDVKGAYSGVFKDRLLQRLEARGIPLWLVKWIDTFCSNRTASIVVNDHKSEQRPLPQAGLRQGSPLSPVLFQFFNVELVQSKINSTGGSRAFVDDYSAWATGPTAEANRSGIQAIIDRALEWERRSGATFEGDKMTIIHFTRNSEPTSDAPFVIKGKEVNPIQSAKTLGLVMDATLRYKEHMDRAAAKGLSAAMCLRTLKILSPRTAGQFFMATVAPTMEYSSTKGGAQAITGAFRTTATAMAKAGASIPHDWGMLCPSLRLPVGYDLDGDMATEIASRMEGILVATSASERAGRVGMRGIVRDTLGSRPGEAVARYSITIGSGDDQNVYAAELEAIAMALRCMPDALQHRQLTVMTSSRSTLEVIARPQQQTIRSESIKRYQAHTHAPCMMD
ncbi:hypothetical protein MRS44_013175 [Fusarium solani]|uniref:uncharacterized protein n=1 Tax=Fusarium solani TaxID=169388 RepID=UPI0032C40042|nr:hypothetical protein MRS44_013175 [Fusarium solani]